MRSRIPSLLFLLLSSTVFAQKLYVWCPKEQISTPRPGFLENDTVDFVVFDGRLLTQNSKINCTSEDIASRLATLIKGTYPSAILNVLNSNAYYKDPASSRITIKIGIAAYHAAFGADVKIGIGSVGGVFSYGVIPEGKWNAITAYAVKIYDYRSDKEVKKIKGVYKIASRPNTGGYQTAKHILSSTYREANQELLFFIDDSLMK